MSRRISQVLLICCVAPAVLLAAPDVLVTDFESATYEPWTAEGTAFGPGPAMGTLSGQMHVDGYRGERLVNSFFSGDAATGTLTSPPMEVTRDYFSFLIGGGGYAENTCINLLLNGEAVRTAVGPNTQPGGSETLEPAFWDVHALKGKTVTLQIVDAATGGWGHINIDHIVQTDEKPKTAEYRRLEKSFVVEDAYLVVPVKNGAKPTELTLEVGGKPVRRYSTELATDPDDVDWYAFFTIESYKAESAKVTVARGARGLCADSAVGHDSRRRDVLHGGVTSPISLFAKGRLEQRSQRHGLP